MAKLTEFFSRIQLTFRRSRNSTKVVLIIAIVLSMGALITLRLSMNDLKDRTDLLKDKAALLEEENQELDEDIEALGSVQSVLDIAEEELGLVQPGTVIYQTEP